VYVVYVVYVPQIRVEIREEFRTSSGPSDAGSSDNVSFDLLGSSGQLLAPRRSRRRTFSGVFAGILVMGVTRETGVISPTDLPILKDCKKNTTASTSGQADKKPGASDCVFAITEGHAANTS
nr:hypothetical protein [Tanacetum cinerariifolium]